jgi:hypothetical protein
VDQYIDMPNFLCENVNPTLIYTFQPDNVSKITSNYRYTFESDGTVTYLLSGGATYKHHVWHYSKDNVLVMRHWLGIPVAAVSYKVDRRSTSPDHELILLSPDGEWGMLGAIFVAHWLQGDKLERLQMITPRGFNRLKVSSSQGLFACTGRPGEFSNAKIPVEIDETISSIARTSQFDLSYPQFASLIDNNKTAGSVLLEYNLTAVPFKPPVVCPVEYAVRSYQYYPNDYDVTAKPSLVPFMQPIVNDAFSPSQSRNNERMSIEGRVEKVRPDVMPLTSYLATAMRDFIDMLIPDDLAHTLIPEDYDEVLRRQDRPSQKNLLARAEWANPMRLIRMFVKKEPYANVKHPRAISQINTVDKREYSKFTYSFEKILKKQPWYAFGKSPKKISQRIVKILEGAQVAMNTDFSRFDGHGSNLMRDLERMALMRAFRHEYCDEVSELHRSQYGLKAVSTSGVWYDTAFSRASGSPETSLFNSLTNAFVAYVALLDSRGDKTSLGPRRAFDSLGIYGGDDGLTADVSVKAYRKAAAMIGQELTVEPVYRGDFGIKFLARIYSPGVWNGDVNSCCDIPRQIGKFHVTVRLGDKVTPAMKFMEKVRSYSLTDYFSPVIGLMCQRAIELEGLPEEPIPGTEGMRSWLAQYDKKFQYKNVEADWMYDYLYQVMPEFEHRKFKRWVKSCNTIQALMNGPMFQRPATAVSKDPVVIDGDVIPHGCDLRSEPREGRVKDLLVSADFKTPESKYALPEEDAPHPDLMIGEIHPQEKKVELVRTPSPQSFRKSAPRNVVIPGYVPYRERMSQAGKSSRLRSVDRGLRPGPRN